MESRDPIKLNRDVDALMIPSGTPILLPVGVEVSVTQSLGGNYTVYVQGNLVRIEGKDADALGLTPPKPDPELTQTLAREEGQVDESPIWAQLRTCYDPEIPVNIVELGLIYQVGHEKVGPTRFRVNVTMTLTAPGCGFGPTLVAEVESKLLQIPDVNEVHVELVFDPPWSMEALSESARLQLNLL